jgi:adenylate cyclase
MDLASAVVEREGGVVDKYIGDEIMALFGAPVSHEDDAVRAVRAAVGIRDAVDTLSLERTSRGERGITMGIGINTGVVVAGNMGSDRRLNYTVLGMSVNIAARLCSQADPQEILMGEATYERVKHCTVTQPAGHRTLRGLSHPLATYALSSVDCVIIPVETDATSETQSSEAFA